MDRACAPRDIEKTSRPASAGHGSEDNGLGVRARRELNGGDEEDEMRLDDLPQSDNIEDRRGDNSGGGGGGGFPAWAVAAASASAPS